MTKIFRYQDLPEVRKNWAIEQLKSINPDKTDQEIEELAERYEWNKAGDLMQEAEVEEDEEDEFIGQDPDYYADMIDD